MARRHKLCLVIACISSVVYLALALYSLYALSTVGTSLNEARHQARYPNDYDVSAFATGVVITLAIIDLIKCIAMTIASIILIFGIYKKRHQLLAPWMYMTAVAVVLTLLGLLGSQGTSTGKIVFILVVVAIQIAAWYPIFSLYRQLRPTRGTQQPPESIPLSTLEPNGLDTGGFRPPESSDPHPSVHSSSTQTPSVADANYNPAASINHPPYNTTQAPPEKF